MFHRKNPTWKGYWGGIMQCQECGNDLDKHSRPDRLFCSDTCRKRHSRRPAQADQSLDRIFSELQDIRRYLKSAHGETHVQKVNERLKRIREELNDILRLRDRETIIEVGNRAELIAGMRKDKV